VAEMKKMATEKPIDLPSTKLRGRASRSGLKVTLNSHIFLMSLSVQVSSSLRMVDLTAALSNWCCVISDSLYFSAALSLGGSSTYFGREFKSIFFLMSRTVSNTVTNAKEANQTSRMARWQFWSVVFAI
jgi:hypothetical protein